jgi:peptidoglycan-associated lipoprotein
MRVNILGVLAGAALLAACETPAEETSATTGGGATAATTDEMGTVGITEEEEMMTGPAPGSQEDLVVTVGDRVFYDFDQSDLKPEARATVEKLAIWLGNFPQVQLLVEGHTDERGTREYNLALGERRANSVKEYLVALGTDPNRVETISFGEERPAVLGSNEEAWTQNRRAVFVVQ